MTKYFTRAIFIASLVLVVGLSARLSFAQGTYDIKEMTPAVKAALDGRKDRFDQLRELKSKGMVGENNRGYVEVLENNAQAESLADAENADRKFIYKAIEQQNNLTNAMGAIEKVFAQVQRDKAMPADKIQDENGNWVSK